MHTIIWRYVVRSDCAAAFERHYAVDGTWAKLHQDWIGKYTGETAEPPAITVAEAVELVKQN